jgi:repressor LexA
MLTKKQLVLLQFIDDNTSKSGISPSFDEMKEALNLKSKSGIHRLIVALEERGFLRRLPHRARALEVIKRVKLPAKEIKPLETSVIQLRNVQEERSKENSLQIPLLGRIAAGVPIEAFPDSANNINIPPQMMGQGQHFALEVKGESMIDAGINHGDIVVIKEQNQAQNGDIVVALINQQEATLKRLYKIGSIIKLKAANSSFSTQEYEANEVTIQGRLVGLLRTY